ncbi:hypothetical protein [Variovorax saccharolyticus]|uniref:hypothetical protein n=1 Tax=Variovorax saccharolyticus TaxID=3053516 RepID=UPI002576731B|nr:hypothetical protein [Variovorax sp. J22R187]MDM0021627.1 hypothetical protein [Variovorax sp. J22R187]
MSMLKRLRGEPRATVSFLGRNLTLYRQGSRVGLFAGLATFVAFNLPWHLLPAGGEMLRLLTTVVGCYLAATLMASRTKAEMGADEAAARWL